MHVKRCRFEVALPLVEPRLTHSNPQFKHRNGLKARHFTRLVEGPASLRRAARISRKNSFSKGTQ